MWTTSPSSSHTQVSVEAAATARPFGLLAQRLIRADGEINVALGRARQALAQAERQRTAAYIDRETTSKLLDRAVARADEIPLLLKARSAHFEAIVELAKSIHPYETPSIGATELVAIDAGYADWLAAETREP